MGFTHRWALLLGLTATAGALDALAFLSLGKVFASFQSGNVLFLGIGLGTGNGHLTLRVAVSLAAFLAGVAAGAHLIGVPRLDPQRLGTEVRAIALEAGLLLLLAALWLAVGTPADEPAVQVVLLGIGAAAMGIQAALSLALKIPQVMTVAVTATLAALGQRLGLGGVPGDSRAPQVETGLMIALLGSYVACALIVASLPREAWVALGPLVLLVIGTVVDVRQAEHADAGKAEPAA
jgi:uncharacterized membrane protein YoaK (UPF0700 family)